MVVSSTASTLESDDFFVAGINLTVYHGESPDRFEIRRSKLPTEQKGMPTGCQDRIGLFIFQVIRM